MSDVGPAFGASRRADIDYLRVGALLLLIIYHVLLVYDTWDWWRVKSSYAGHWAEYLITAITPWRMTLVFFVGGVAARFMFESSKPIAFIRDRAAKLLTAFAFAVVAIIPLQRYIRLDNAGMETPSYLHFLLHEARFAMQLDGVWYPDLAQAWFLPYLFIYSVAIVAFWSLAPRTFAWLQGAIERLPIWAIASGLMVGLGLHQAILMPQQPETRLVFDDLTSHARFVPVFLLGALVAKSQMFFQKLVAARHWIWAMSALLLISSFSSQYDVISSAASPATAFDYHFTHGLYGGVALLGVVAFGAHALRRPSKTLTYATDAILPIYLMHQTVLVVAADLIVPQRWPLPLEMPVLFALTLLVPLAIYHVMVRPFVVSRVLFGLRPHARGEKKKPDDAATPEPKPLHP
jgi:glucan biosynthesis protein C